MRDPDVTVNAPLDGRRDMQIHSATHVHGPHAINTPHAARVDSTQQPMRAAATTDTVDISETGRLLEMAARLPDVRSDRVQQLRAEISQGEYETSEKLDLALERLLDELA
jgi:negative regulator of flagellin synthesis FlgM